MHVYGIWQIFFGKGVFVKLMINIITTRRNTIFDEFSSLRCDPKNQMKNLYIKKQNTDFYQDTIFFSFYCFLRDDCTEFYFIAIIKDNILFTGALT